MHKKLFVSLAMLPGISLAGGFGGEGVGWYMLIFAVVLALVVTMPLGVLGGFVVSFFTQSKRVGFLGVSVILAGLMFLAPGAWSVEVGIHGFLAYLFCEYLLIFSFLTGWGLSDFLRWMIEKSKTRPDAEVL